MKNPITHKRVNKNDIAWTLCGRSSFDRTEWRDDWKEVICSSCINLKNHYLEMFGEDKVEE